MEQRQLAPEEKEEVGNFARHCLLGKELREKIVKNIIRKTWRGTMLIQYFKFRGSPDGVPRFLCKPQFSGHCSFACPQSSSSSQHIEVNHHHFIMEECTAEDVEKLRQEKAFIVKGGDAIICIRKEEICEVLRMLKTFFLLDFTESWNKGESRRLRYLLGHCLYTNWRVEASLKEAGDFEQIEYIKKKKIDKPPLLAPRDIYEIDPRWTGIVRKYGRIYFHQLMEKSMFDRTRWLDKNGEEVKKGVALVNHRFWACRECRYHEGSTEWRHYHYVVDVVYQCSEEYKRLHYANFFENVVPLGNERWTISNEIGCDFKYHFTAGEVALFEKVFLVRFGKKPVPPIQSRMAAFFEEQERSRWIGDPEAASDRYETDPSIPEYCPLYEKRVAEEFKNPRKPRGVESIERLEEDESEDESEDVETIAESRSEEEQSGPSTKGQRAEPTSNGQQPNTNCYPQEFDSNGHHPVPHLNGFLPQQPPWPPSGFPPFRNTQPFGPPIENGFDLVPLNGAPPPFLQQQVFPEHGHVSEPFGIPINQEYGPNGYYWPQQHPNPLPPQISPQVENGYPLPNGHNSLQPSPVMNTGIAHQALNGYQQFPYTAPHFQQVGNGHVMPANGLLMESVSRKRKGGVANKGPAKKSRPTNNGAGSNASRERLMAERNYNTGMSTSKVFPPGEGSQQWYGHYQDPNAPSCSNHM